MSKFTLFWHKKIVPILPILKKISEKGQAFLVGGSVRDLLLCEIGSNGTLDFDLDIEIHGFSSDDLELLLSSFGPVDLIGKQFGVFKLHSHAEVDWSLPRIDSVGRKPTVELDPNMTIEKALFRRDITINAMALNLSQFLNRELPEKLDSNFIEDPYFGFEDLKSRIARPVSESKFVEDPLRFFRVMQFISRFKLSPSIEMNELSKKIDLKNLSPERVTEEFKKMLLKSEKPSLGLAWMQSLGRLSELFPKLSSYSEKALDRAAEKTLKYEDQKKRLIILLAAMCQHLDHSLVFDFLYRGNHSVHNLMFPRRIAQLAHKILVLSLTSDWGSMTDGELKLQAYKAEKDFSLEELILFWSAINSVPENLVKNLILKAKRLGVLKNAEEALVKGQDILHLGYTGPKVGELLEAAYAMQVVQNFSKDKILQKLSSL